MLISQKSSECLRDRIRTSREVFCRGLFLSARWFVLSQVARSGVHVVVLPNREAAEYCAADLYGLIQGDRVFFLPESGKSVQRTSAIGRLLERTGDSPVRPANDDVLVIVTYPEALSEEIPATDTIRDAVFRIAEGQEISHDEIIRTLSGKGFEKVDFVSAPGQYAIRGSIVAIFSFSENFPYRISFWGNEIESIHSFDCNTQLSKEKIEKAEIIPDVVGSGSQGQPLTDIFPKDSCIWLDSADMYSREAFFSPLTAFRHIYIDAPLSYPGDDFVYFQISPQPSFNKNFELLTEDIRSHLENGYQVLIYGDKEQQLERIRSILSQNGGLQPQFVSGQNIHNGFIDAQDKICCYSDHEIFDRFHRVSLRRPVE